MTTTALETSPVFARRHSTVVGNRVVVGMDDHPASVAALRFAATEAAFRGGDVLVVHVWQYPSTWGFPVMGPQEVLPGDYIETGLQMVVDAVIAERARAGEPAVSITAEVMEGGSATALTAVAHGAALLVLGTRHHNRLLGSVSQSCTSHASCPVVVVPAPPQPERTPPRSE